MIRRAHFQNYKSLRDVSIEFAPLTVLIGPNDSGKTSILEALYLPTQASMSVIGQDALGGAHGTDRVTWNGLDKPLLFHIEAERNGEQLSYEFEILRGMFQRDLLQRGRASIGRPTSADHVQVNGATLAAHDHQQQTTLGLIRREGRQGKLHDYVSVIEALYTSPIYRFDPRMMRRPSVPQTGASLSATGENLAAILDSIITGPNRDAANQLNEQLGKAMGSLKGVSVPPARFPVDGRPPPAGAKTIEFIPSADGAAPVPCELASDGALIVAAFLALALSSNASTLLIEEPENGVHPGLLKDIFALLRSITTNAAMPPRQIIVTTHNPLLLNYAQPEEIRIVYRDPERGTQVARMSDVPGVQKLLGEFGAGELWYLLGEKALLEGKQP